MNYYISDLHLYHEACMRFDDRPFESLQEMHDTILNNWNSRVTNGDTVYILGDMSLRGRLEDLISFVARLKGRKVLIKGNHDDISDYRYKQLFSEIYDYKEIRDQAGKERYHLVLMHYPILSFNKMKNNAILLYGHTHNSAEDVYFQKCLSTMNEIDCRHAGDTEIRAYNVGCMKSYINYMPRTLAEIIDAQGKLG